MLVRAVPACCLPLWELTWRRNFPQAGAVKIFLIRHGHAVDAAEQLSDGERYLTKKGRRAVREVGRRRCREMAKGTPPNTAIVV